MVATPLNTILLGLTALSNLTLATMVYRKSPRSLMNRLVMGFTLNVGLWAVIVLIILFQTAYEPLLMWVRISHSVAAFTGWFVLALVYCFREEGYSSRLLFVIFLFSCLLSALSMTPLIIAGVDVPVEQKELLYGPLFPLYSVFFTGTICYSIFFLFRQLRKVRGITRYQIRYFLGGIITSFLLGSVANLFLPLLKVQIIDLRPYGPVFTLIMVIFITYAIVKYRLMDIHFALRIAVIYALPVILLGAVFSLPLLFLTESPAFQDPPIFLLSLFLALVLAVFFQPTKDFLQATVVDRYFYRRVYNYYGALREANKAMVSILNLEDLVNCLVTKVVEIAQIQKGGFYLRRDQDGCFDAVASKTLHPTPSSFFPEQLEPENPLLLYMQARQETLLLTDLRGNLSSLELQTTGVLREMEAEAVVPVVMGGTLDGVFILGPKLSGEPYSLQDVNLLSTLASQLAVALKNAQFHREVSGMKLYLENVVENMGNGLVTVDASEKIITFNGVAEKITGLAASDMLGKPAGLVLHPELAFLLRQALHEDSESGEAELEILAGESWRYLRCNTALFELARGEYGVILVLIDITDQKELEKEKNRAERLASLGEMAAGIAHEIKNPLVSIKTFAELLPEKYEEQDFRCNFSQIVGKEIERINNLVIKLLGFARESEQPNQYVDVEDVIEEILMLLAPRLDAQRIKLDKRCQSRLPAVWVDRNQLKQALLNVCQNAVEAMPGGGKLKVALYWQREEQSSAGHPGKASQGAGNIRIIIEDTGEGISPSIMEKIFNPFFTTKSYGIGIGLSISHQVVGSYGGTIQVHSREGEGTIFEIFLPVSKAYGKMKAGA